MNEEVRNCDDIKNRDEAIACRFLQSLNMGVVKHEPDGNVTPDFRLDGRIGVEVRRLNQNYVYPDGERHGYENLAIRMWHRMRNLLATFGPSINGESWYVFMEFRRPLEWNSLKNDVVKQLDQFKRTSPRANAKLRFGDKFEVDLERAGKDTGRFFQLIGSADGDPLGAVLAEVERNLRFCIEEKATKVSPVLGRYDEWWLVLVNYVDINMEAQDYEGFTIESDPSLVHPFKRIFLVDFGNADKWFEIAIPSAL
jgi:hypothetical protein